MNTLTDSADDFTACATDADDRAILRRAFMAGALAALTSQATRERRVNRHAVGVSGFNDGLGVRWRNEQE